MGRKEARKQIRLLKLRYIDKEIKCEAAKELGKMRDVKAAKHLIRVLDTRVDQELAIAVIEALGEIGDEAALKSISKIVSDHYSYALEVEASAAKAFAKNVDIMLDLLVQTMVSRMHYSPEKNLAIEALSEITNQTAIYEAIDKAGINQLLDSLIQEMCYSCFEEFSVFHNPSRRRVLLAKVLAKLGQPEWQQSLNGKSVDYVKLAKIKNPYIIEQAMENLEPPRISIGAIQIVGEVGEISALSRLETLLDYYDKNIQKEAAKAMIQIAKSSPNHKIIGEDTMKRLANPHCDVFFHTDKGEDRNRSSDCTHYDNGSHVDNGGFGVKVDEF